MTLLELYQTDPFMRYTIERIMLERWRLSYKRDRLRAELRKFSSRCETFTMSELRELQYMLHPQDQRRKMKRKEFFLPSLR